MFGIFISNQNLSSVAKQQILDENKMNQQNYFDIICDDLYDKLIKKIQIYLYFHKIWLYESNGDCVMIDFTN